MKKFGVAIHQKPPCGRADYVGGWQVVLRDPLTGEVLMRSEDFTDMTKAGALMTALETALGPNLATIRELLLAETLAKAVDAYEKLTPEQKLAHRREQAISWVYGEANMRAPEGKELLSKEEVARIVDRKIEDGSFTLRP